VQFGSEFERLWQVNLKTKVMIKACLFDLFGTVVSDAKCSKNAPEQAMPASRDESLDALSDTGAITGLTPGEVRDRVYENTKAFFEYDGAQMPDMILPGALDFVKELHRNGIRLASTSTRCHPDKVLSSIGLYGLFDYIVDPKEVAGRPDPEALLKAANHLGVAVEDCVAIESTPEGLQAAKAAGIRSVAVGDLSVLYDANMGVTSLKSFTLLQLKDGIEGRKSC
jgi:beta-phosphoglucomutase